MKNKPAYLLFDKQVSLTMLFIGIIAIALLAFRFKSSEPCQPISFSYSALNLHAGSPVHFKADIQNAKDYEWNFGDNSQPKRNSTTATHVYQKPGKYTVTLVINGQCESVRFIEIKEAPISEDYEWQPLIFCSDTAVVNEPIIFRDMTPNAASWEWQFGETGRVDAIKKDAVYVFKSSGTKTIHLIVNGRLDKVASRIIYVKEAKQLQNEKDVKNRQVHRKPAVIRVEPINLPIKLQPVDTIEIVPPKAPEITDSKFSDYLEDVVEGRKTATDFSDYLCGNLNIPVVYNGSTVSFSKMCSELRKFKKVKKIKKPVVVTTKNGSTGCVLSMYVNVQKRGLLDQIF